MKRNVFYTALLGLALLAAGCASSSTGPVKESAAIKKIAIVSLSVSDVGGSVRAGSIGSTPVSGLINSTVNDMLANAEKKLGRKWQVSKASGFINNAGYQKAGVPKTLTVYVPRLSGREMPVFTQVSKEIKGGIINPQKAGDLCRLLKVDAVVLIFSEWSAKTGGIVPTTKALTKNILTIWDSNGNQVAKKRVDMVGKKTLGAGGIKAVNQETIGEWRDAYNRSLEEIIGTL